MKNLFLLLFIAICLIACSAEPLEMEPLELKVDSQYFNASSEVDGCLGPDNSKTITISEATAIESWDEVRKLYLGLLPQGISRSGTFTPSIKELIGNFKKMGIGEYTTIYTVNSDKCTDTVVLTVIVGPDLQEEPICNLYAGPDNSRIITLANAISIESWDEVRKLYLGLLSPDVPRNGVFNPTIKDLIRMFNDPNRGSMEGDYTTVYTIVDGDCSDSVELTVKVISN
jgi:hypothetical protein